MKKELKILYFNIRSLRNKVEYLEALLYEESYKNADVIVLTETWLGYDETKYINLPNYQGINRCREDSRGGGVAIYIKLNEEIKPIRQKHEQYSFMMSQKHK